MAINIKNERTVESVKQLARHLGVSYTAAISIATEAALRIPNPPAEDQTLQRINRIVADYQAHVPAAQDLDTETLYDANGLFR